MIIGTHSGQFHADDVLALATLTLAGEVTEVIRTRDPERLAACNMRVDVGRRYDVATRDFDHHQKGGAGKRANGVPYASFGLIWREYGAQVAGSQEAAQLIDDRMVQQVDAEDNGFDLFTSEATKLGPYNAWRLLTHRNPEWTCQPSDAEMDAAFDGAVQQGTDMIRAEVERVNLRLKANVEVRAAIAQQPNAQILVLERFAPWYEVVMAEAPEAQLVVFPVWPKRNNDWTVQAVNVQPGSFERRIDLPEQWAGKEGEALVQVTGVADAHFCHSARFLAIAHSKAGAMQLAQLALNHATKG